MAESTIGREHRVQTESDRRSLAQNLARLFGIAFLGVGILGFVPGVTSNYGDMSFAGHDSGAQLLGIFQVSILHNIVHLLFGVGLLWASSRWSAARTALLVSGVIYLVLFVYGLFVGGGDSANFVPVDNADDVLHLVLSLALLASWAVTGRDDRTRTRA